jgi:hypothetical protein
MGALSEDAAKNSADAAVAPIKREPGRRTKRLTRNECGMVFRVISMLGPEAACFALVGKKIVA